MNGYLEATQQNPVLMLVGPLAITVGFAMIWLWLRHSKRAAADAILVIIAALVWISVTLVVFSKTSLTPSYKKLVGLLLAVVCWWGFNRLRHKRADEFTHDM